jgi:hypothetical protein
MLSQISRAFSLGGRLAARQGLDFHYKFLLYANPQYIVALCAKQANKGLSCNESSIEEQKQRKGLDFAGCLLFAFDPEGEVSLVVSEEG